jgi:protein ImuB
VDTAAFVAKALADELQGRLAAHGLACTLVAIEAETEHGEQLVRRWRQEGALTASALSERARWQLDGWLASGDARGRPTGGITLLRLTPEEVRPDDGRQLGFWGGAAAGQARAARALARVQGLLGPEAVATARLVGGRDPADQARLVTWGDRPEPAAETVVTRPAGGRTEIPPWPGRLAGPPPAVVHHPPWPADVRDEKGHPVGVTGRGMISAPPAGVAIAGAWSRQVTGWAGPWPLEERWWEAGGRRKAWLQVLLDDDTAYLLARQTGRWWVEASYE